MLSDKLKKNSTSNKKQDIKLLAIAAISVILLIGILFWLFSGSDDNKNKISATDINLAANKTKPEKELPKPPVLNEKALATMNINGDNATNVVSDSSYEKDITKDIASNAQDSNVFKQEELDKIAIVDKYKEPDNTLFPTEQKFAQETNKNVNNSGTFDSLQSVKTYLNSIRNDIRIVDTNSFVYKDKVYKKGDIFNSLTVSDVSNIFIRFSTKDLEYSLRFIGEK